MKRRKIESSWLDDLKKRVGAAQDAWNQQRVAVAAAESIAEPPVPKSPLEQRKQALLAELNELEEMEKHPDLFELRQSLHFMASNPHGLLIMQTMMMLYDQHKDEFQMLSPEVYTWIMKGTYHHSPQALRSLALHLEAAAALVESKESQKKRDAASTNPVS